ncbi:hypothetical protein L6452_14542 [Arctium lappa]|uniref:Uncharacterized protein n=1 Tax=Arctium lappa TaxID=4217 RepID=A0ACB9CL91_ARCLA|nr:hypothetical protein L6452_14542 [Arctium lappa]
MRISNRYDFYTIDYSHPSDGKSSLLISDRFLCLKSGSTTIIIRKLSIRPLLLRPDLKPIIVFRRLRLHLANNFLFLIL